MLERFKVPEEIAVRVMEPELRQTVEELFKKYGLPDDDAVLAADVVVSADLRGVESHGVANLMPGYRQAFAKGEINPTPKWRVERETAATAAIDCDGGHGIVIAPKAMELAIDKARETGVGVVTMRDGRHLAMAAYHAMLALPYDMIGVCMTSTPPTVYPTWGAEPRVGTNPIAIAAPSEKEAPFVFDAATSAVAAGKQSIARRLGIDLLAGWVVDQEGSPDMRDHVPVPERVGDNFRLLPLGSTRELGSHKGYGLSGMVDVLAGIMSGGGPGLFPGRPDMNHYVAAYSVGAFVDVAEFKQTMDRWLKALRTTKPAPGHERVLYPGLSEAEETAKRRVDGIPLHPETVAWFQETCAELGVEYRLTND